MTVSYHIVYGFEDGEPKDGPHLGSGSAWLAWSEWALGFDGYEEIHSLAHNGWAYVKDLATECDRLLSEEGDEDLFAITRTVQDAAAKAPEGAETVIVTDGTPPGDEDESDEDE